MIYCKKCYNELPDNSVFCGKCGQKVSGKSGVNNKVIILGAVGVFFVVGIIIISMAVSGSLVVKKGTANNGDNKAAVNGNNKKTADAVKNSATPTIDPKKKIEDLKANQKVAVESASIKEQSSEYKALYPDMMEVIVRNKTDKTIKNMKTSCLGFDKNGYPLKIKGWVSFVESYEFNGKSEDCNIVAGETFGKGKGYQLDPNHGISKILACVSEVEFYDGTNWSNPYYKYWLEEYKEKPLH
jgi:hypothetical protein